jgi:hypothetical protein
MTGCLLRVLLVNEFCTACLRVTLSRVALLWSVQQMAAGLQFGCVMRNGLGPAFANGCCTVPWPNLQIVGCVGACIVHDCDCWSAAVGGRAGILWCCNSFAAYHDHRRRVKLAADWVPTACSAKQRLCIVSLQRGSCAVTRIGLRTAITHEAVTQGHIPGAVGLPSNMAGSDFDCMPHRKQSHRPVLIRTIRRRQHMRCTAHVG